MPSIAIIGASNDRTKFGNKAVRAYASKGWRVYPINPKHARLEGLVCYASVVNLPAVPDFASLYVPPSAVPSVLSSLAEKGVTNVYFNPGTESPEGIERAKTLGLHPLVQCSIRAIGLDPDSL